MGSVYRATERGLERLVALKVIAGGHARDARTRARFRMEARTAAAIEHPHVVPIYDADEHDGVLYLSMRLIDGPSLAEVIAREGRLDTPRAVQIIVQVASALDAAHARGVLHRDIKPANVMLERRGDTEHAYVMDFGVARPTVGNEAVTVPGAIVGTPGYLSPEVLRGAPADQRADVYALGCTLFELLTGTTPFPAASLQARIGGHLYGPIPRVRDAAVDTPPALERVVMSALAKASEDRPASAAAFAESALAAVDSRAASTPLAAAAAASLSARDNLPARGRVIGRAPQVRELTRACREHGASVISGIGPGGVGKPPLALAAAYELASDFPDGRVLVELEAVPDPADVLGAIMRAIDLAAVEEVSAAERLAAHLRGRRMLLILDNFEHLLDAAAGLADIAAQAPATCLLVTSQAPLNLRAERVIRLAPLALPEPAAVDPQRLAGVPAVELLVREASRADSRFALTPANAASVARICTQLDGLPLALELAAARLALFHADELAERLERDLNALGHGARDLPARQRGLSATLDWTTSLLDAGERELLHRLAVFADGFSAEVAEAVGDADAIERLAVLYDVALIRRAAGGRFTIPPPVRLYALERLRATGAEHDARLRQSAALTAKAERADRVWWTDLPTSRRIYAEEAENIREAMAYLRTAAPHPHARLVAAAARWFIESAAPSEILVEIDAALATRPDEPLRVRLLCRRAVAIEGEGSLEASLAAVEACESAGSAFDLAEALFGLSAHLQLTDPQQALRVALRAQAHARATNDRVARDQADLATGTALTLTGAPAQGLAVLTLLNRRVRPGDRIAMYTTIALADAALACGDASGALAGYCRWLRDFHALHSHSNEAFQLDSAAIALTELGRHEEAIIAAAISDLLRAEWSIGRPAAWTATRDEKLRVAHDALEPAVLQHAQAYARRLGPERGSIWVAARADPDTTDALDTPTATPSAAPDATHDAALQRGSQERRRRAP